MTAQPFGSSYVAIGGELGIEGPYVDIYASGTGTISLDLDENAKIATSELRGCEINETFLEWVGCRRSSYGRP
jgi:hypothetical protein